MTEHKVTEHKVTAGAKRKGVIRRKIASKRKSAPKRKSVSKRRSVIRRKSKRVTKRKSAPKHKSASKRKRVSRRKSISRRKGGANTNVCPRGEIEKIAHTRKAYTKNNGTKVKKTTVSAVCIKDLGKPGKGPNVIELKNEHELSEAGYHDVKNLSKNKRRKALEKVIKKHGAVYVIRSLIGRANLNIRTDPKAHKIFKEDQEWVSKKYAKTK